MALQNEKNQASNITTDKKVEVNLFLEEFSTTKTVAQGFQVDDSVKIKHDKVWVENYPRIWDQTSNLPKI